MTQKIMAVDDSESIRQMVSFSLRMGDYEVMEAENGQDAYEKLLQADVDMLITDLDMPEMNGIELIRQLRAIPRYRNMPIILLTIHSDAEIKKLARLSGANGWITKPFRPNQLTEVVKKVLHGRYHSYTTSTCAMYPERRSASFQI
ncbi:MAG: response regulator [Desulfobacterales bacterium]